jgi:hypothetical protein
VFNVKVQRNLPVPSTDVWPVLKDFGGHYKFDPYVEYCPISNGINEGLGSERELKFYGGPTVTQKIIDYEEGRMILIGVSESTWPIKRAWTRITLEDTQDNSSLLGFHMNFVPSLGPLAPLIGLYFKPVFTNQYNVVLRSIEHFVKTGEKFYELDQQPLRR